MVHGRTQSALSQVYACKYAHSRLNHRHSNGYSRDLLFFGVVGALLGYNYEKREALCSDIEYARRLHFRPSLRRAPHYTCERGSRTLACRHGGCAASHGPPPAGFLRHLTAQSSFFAKTCQHFPHTFPKALPQTSAGCSVLGIIRGYKLRTCPSDRAIGAQPKGATSCVFLFGLLFEVFFLPTAAGPCGAEYKHTVHSASAAPTWRTAPGPWGPNERRPQCKLRQGGRNRPRLRLSARFTGLSAPN